MAWLSYTRIVCLLGWGDGCGICSDMHACASKAVLLAPPERSIVCFFHQTQLLKWPAHTSYDYRIHSSYHSYLTPGTALYLVCLCIACCCQMAYRSCASNYPMHTGEIAGFRTKKWEEREAFLTFHRSCPDWWNMAHGHHKETSWNDGSV